MVRISQIGCYVGNGIRVEIVEVVEMHQVDKCNKVDVEMNRTSSMPKSVLGYGLDKGQYLFALCGLKLKRCGGRLFVKAWKL